MINSKIDKYLNIKLIKIIMNSYKKINSKFIRKYINSLKTLIIIEKFKIIKLLLTVLFNYIKKNPLIIMSEKYDDLISEYLLDILKLQFGYLFDSTNEVAILMDFNIIISSVKLLFELYIIPPRSYNNTFIRINPNLKSIDKKLNYLNNVYQPEQRTDEWYNFRHNILTASNIWKAFKSESTRNELIYEKCQPFKLFSKPSINSPMHWGQKYEPLSVMYYEMQYNTKISDFGCIPHKNYSFLAASPDGINTLSTSKLYGRMLEIKNIVNRKITGIPKYEYWTQMQIQMEVCELNECDFLETKFIEYLNFEEFSQDGTFIYSNDNKIKGVILVFEDSSLNILYRYMPLKLTSEEYIIWKNNELKLNKELNFLREIFWKLEEISCVLVLRNKFWFNNALPIINNLWTIISEEKITGYQHRAPKLRKKSDSICLINSNLFLL